MEDVELLRQEVERLTRELDEANQEKATSGQYGLLLLDEKAALTRRCDELETLYDTARSEMEILKEVSRETRVWYPVRSSLLRAVSFQLER